MTERNLYETPVIDDAIRDMMAEFEQQVGGGNPPTIAEQFPLLTDPQLDPKWRVAYAVVTETYHEPDEQLLTPKQVVAGLQRATGLSEQEIVQANRSLINPDQGYMSFNRGENGYSLDISELGLQHLHEAIATLRGRR